MPMHSLKEESTVFTINGFLRGQHGQFRIVVLAKDRYKAAEYMGLVSDIGITVSRDTRDWKHYDETTSIGDIFVTPLGTHKYIPVDAEDIEL